MFAICFEAVNSLELFGIDVFSTSMICYRKYERNYELREINVFIEIYLVFHVFF